MTKGESAIRNPKSAIIWLLFAVVVVAVYFAGLTIPLVGPDEPRYAQVAREMFERGDWITPTLGGFHWFEKPALLYWLQIASYSLFGVSEFSARFGSALFGLGTVASLWVLGRKAEGSDENPERRSTIDFANWLALIAASTAGIVAFAHGASFDIILTFPITAALVSFFIYDSGRGKGWLVSFYFFVGLAVLAKGLVGILFPFAIVGFYHLLAWKLPHRALVFSLFWGMLFAAAVASTWYLPMYRRHGWEFVDQFFIQHHFQRYTSNKYLHPQPFYFFFWVLPLMTIPWLPFFVASLWELVGRVRTGSEEIAEAGAPGQIHRTSRPLQLFAIAWLTVPLLFFSFSGSKLPGYILPAVPAAVILTAGFVYRFVQRNPFRRRLVEAIAASTFAVILIAIVAFVPGFAETDSLKSLFAVAHSRGLDGLPGMTMHRVNHNAEFYATGPLVRDGEGKQNRLTGPKEVREEMTALGSSRALVLIPPEYIFHLTQSDLIRAEVLQSNEDWALTLVSER
ncbi:MAG TPA: glycosyltransferase family 39 protein [Pyrinomonadaceae bacterium]|nr:glycosyltransferase family 39 protein [Pyrinomonadaceae bacterium]